MFSGNGDNGMYMPVMPAGGYGYGGGNGGFGFGGDGIWGGLLLGLLFGGLGGWGGFGGWGGGFGGMGGVFGMDAALLAPYFTSVQTQNEVSRGFDTQNLGNQINAVQGSIDSLRTENQLSNIQQAVTSGFGDTALGIAGINQNICQTGNGITQQLYNNEINSLNRSFAEQTANVQGFNGVTRQLADCCCENRLGLANLGADLAREACADRAAVTDGVRDILANQNAGIQRILDQMCNDKIDSKNEKISDLERQLTMANLAASQTAQTARLEANNARQTQQIEDYIRPQINPAYIVPNPYAYNFPYGWNNGGWNNGCGCNGSF